MSEEVNELLDKLGKLEDAPLIWVNKKVYDTPKEIERLNNIIKQIKKCIDYYAIENEDFSKLYNNEEIEILKIIGSDKE